MVFPTFFNLSLNLAIRSSWSEPHSAPGLVLLTDCSFFLLASALEKAQLEIEKLKENLIKLKENGE